MSTALQNINRGLLEAVEHAQGGAPVARVHPPRTVDARPGALQRRGQRKDRDAESGGQACAAGDWLIGLWCATGNSPG